MLLAEYDSSVTPFHSNRVYIAPSEEEIAAGLAKNEDEDVLLEHYLNGVAPAKPNAKL
jgi:hypothetical protein|eukprot:COSAG01_NODE_13436_length_1585_cov_6.290040_1_plen_58_part_00